MQQGCCALPTQRNGVLVKQCFIPTTKIEDFIHRMENSNGGVLYKYVKIRMKPSKGEIVFDAIESTPKDILQ